MALTEKQKNNIYHLTDDDLIELIDICTDKLGIVSQVQYIEVTGYNKSRTMLNNDMNSGKINFIKIGGDKISYGKRLVLFILILILFAIITNKKS